MKFKIILLAAAVMVSMAADARIFTAEWRGDRFGTFGVATGTFDINTAVYPTLAGSEPVVATGPDFKVLEIVVTGASSGNGTFTGADFGTFHFAAYSPLNYTTELVGQAMSNGFTFRDLGLGFGGPSGDFNVFSPTPGAPNGTYYFVLTTDGGHGENLLLVSLVGGVPEPMSWGLMIGGFGLVGTALRRRRVALTA